MSAVKTKALQVHHTNQFVFFINTDIFELDIVWHGLFQGLYVSTLKVMVNRQYTSPFARYISKTVGTLKADFMFDGKFVKQSLMQVVFFAQTDIQHLNKQTKCH